jgi:UDPglucose 6-dehydrogenase
VPEAIVVKSIFIVGSGLVGQATGKGLVAKGFRVTFIDVRPAIVNQLRQQGYEAFEASEVKKTDAAIFMLSVPTYSLKPGINGLDFVKEAATSIGNWLSKTDKYCLVVIRSTVLPGTTEGTIIPILEEYSRKSAGRDFGICANPEYLRERCAEEDFLNPWLVLIGELDKRSGDLLQEVYHWVDCPVYRLPIREAEIQKFVHNIFNATKISFFNEMRLVCRQMGLDCEKIFPRVVQSAEAIWNPLYGTRDLGPFGGSCLPKDTIAFLSWAKEQGMETPLVDAVLRVNQALVRHLEPASSKASR